MTLAFFSLGSNQGDRRAHLEQGIATVTAGEPHRVSSLYETAPWGGVEQDSFWNLVLEVETTATPDELFARIQEAEARAHRERAVRWGSRTLDVDLLLFGDWTSDDPRLTVPHPRMGERAFVLVPLAELAPERAAEFTPAPDVTGVVLLGTLSAEQ